MVRLVGAEFGEAISSLDAANAVFNDIAETKEIVKTKEELIEKLRCGGVFPGYPEHVYYEEYAEIDEIDRKFQRKYGEKAVPRDHDDWHDELQAAYKRHDMEIEQKIREAAEKLANERWDELKNLVLVKLSYSDNDGTFGTVMEHGDIFENLPHIAISNH